MGYYIPYTITVYFPVCVSINYLPVAVSDLSDLCHLISTGYMTLQKTACARTEIFQDVFDRDFKQCSEGEKATICGFSFTIGIKAYILL